MRLARGSLLTLVVVVGFSCWPATLAGASGAAKMHRCKGHRVPVTVNGKTTCTALSKVFPRPRAIDLRLVDLRAALELGGTNALGPRARHGRLPFAGFGRTGLQVQKKLERILPRMLALIDKARSARQRSQHAGEITAHASALCNNGPVDHVGDFLGAALSSNAEGDAGIMQIPAGGNTYRVTWARCRGGGGQSVASCPKANGTADGFSRPSLFEITTEVRNRHEVLSRQLTTFEDTSTAHGQTAADARLDYVDITAKRVALVVATGGIVQRGAAVRHLRVLMRTGAYDVARATLELSGDPVADDADDFASTVARWTTAFREAEGGGGTSHEDGWTTFNRKDGPYCATPVFSPASNTVKLRPGQDGELSVSAKVQGGGASPSKARWTLLGPLNASFSPTSSRDQAPHISYTVVNSPSGEQVQVTARLTSTAGVGEAKWTQPIGGITINHIGGHISGSFSQATVGPNGASVFTFSGSLAYSRSSPAPLGGADGQYSMTAGDITVVASGTDFTGLTGCAQSGSQDFKLDPSGTLSVSGTPPELTPPYGYSFAASPPSQMMTITRSACPPGAESFEGTTAQIAVPVQLGTNSSHSSPDGATFTDSEDQSAGSSTIHLSWGFRGTP